jgi:hypothetical protein
MVIYAKPKILRVRIWLQWGKVLREIINLKYLMSLQEMLWPYLPPIELGVGGGDCWGVKQTKN